MGATLRALRDRLDASRRATWFVGAACLGALAVGVALTTPLLLVPLALGLLLVGRSVGRARAGLQIDQIDRLRKAELSLAAAPTTEAAAHELAEHAIALLGAPSAVVLIEGIGDTVRVGAGDATGTRVYGDGSRMRLLDDDGVPCGSIAVSARSTGKPYTDTDERILDALAERVSSTLHRLSLFAEVQDERRTLDDVFTSSSDGLFSTGPDHRVRSWNPAMARITGVTAAEAKGEQSSTVFRPVGEDGVARFGQCDPGRQPGSTETRLVSIETADGEQKWLTCSWSSLSEGGYVVVARDDTERKKLQDDKDGWIAQVSHELRTPLTPIKGFLHTLSRRDDQLGPEDRKKIYEVMLREGKRLEDLVDSLLQATNLDRPGDLVVPEVVDWRAMAEEQVDLIKRQDPSRELALTIARRVPKVVADVQLATSVLTNLLSNALKYTPPGTAIEVTIARKGDSVLTTVADHGAGVPAGDRDRIFDKFTRLGDHLTRPQQGVGLGLYIARQSIERLGGEIWVDANPGGGAAFSFTLPVHSASRAEPRAEPRPKAGTAG